MLIADPNIGLAVQHAQHFLDRRADASARRAGSPPLLEDTKLPAPVDGEVRIRVRRPPPFLASDD
jgi:hypothetical protein